MDRLERCKQEAEHLNIGLIEMAIEELDGQSFKGNTMRSVHLPLLPTVGMLLTVELGDGPGRGGPEAYSCARKFIKVHVLRVEMFAWADLLETRPRVSLWLSTAGYILKQEGLGR